jgi:hypothetical protein
LKTISSKRLRRILANRYPSERDTALLYDVNTGKVRVIDLSQYRQYDENKDE